VLDECLADVHQVRDQILNRQLGLY
jgi:hypothetical protein